MRLTLFGVRQKMIGFEFVTRAQIKPVHMFCILITIQFLFYLSIDRFHYSCDSSVVNNSSYGWSFLPPSSTIPRKVPILDKRMAVVVTLSHVDKCEAVRLRHLIDTSGLEVWVLHGHHSLEETKPQVVNQSEAIISSTPGLHAWPQSSEPIEDFDSKVSGATKSSFLRFLISHEQYDFAWHVESDVLYTGRWNQVLVTEERESDLIYTKQWNKTSDPGWWTRVSKSPCAVDGESCQEIMPFQTYWMVARVSRRLATALIESLEKGQASGHHECLLAPFCKKRGFITKQLDKGSIGVPFKAGNVLPWYERKAEKRTNSLARDGKAYPNKMYHPVKCVAYTSATVMQAEVDQWLV